MCGPKPDFTDCLGKLRGKYKMAIKPAAAKPKAAPAKPAAAAAKAAPAAKAAAAKPAPVELITLRNLAATVSEEQGLSQKQTASVLAATIAQITVHLKKGARIRIAGLGTLEVRKRPARMGRNPATGEPLKIKASKKVAFRAAKDLSEAI
jgi:DNA-binding protein HU-beta